MLSHNSGCSKTPQQTNWLREDQERPSIVKTSMDVKSYAQWFASVPMAGIICMRLTAFSSLNKVIMGL